MKWIALPLLAALALFVTACEQHPAAETEAALNAEGISSSEAKPKTAFEEAPKPTAPKPAAPAARTEATEKAPKFFDTK